MRPIHDLGVPRHARRAVHERVPEYLGIPCNHSIIEDPGVPADCRLVLDSCGTCYEGRPHHARISKQLGPSAYKSGVLHVRRPVDDSIVGYAPPSERMPMSRHMAAPIVAVDGVPTSPERLRSRQKKDRQCESSRHHTRIPRTRPARKGQLALFGMGPPSSRRCPMVPTGRARPLVP